MGDCRFCGQRAGLFRDVHPACETQYYAAVRQMTDTATETARGFRSLASLLPTLQGLVPNNVQSAALVRQAQVNGFELAVKACITPDGVSAADEGSLLRYCQHVALKRDELDANGAFTRLMMGLTLRDISQGKIATRYQSGAPIPFNLGQNERLIWLFPDAAYYEEKIFREFEGGHQGVSIRVVSGVYYRTGRYRGRPVERQQRTLVGRGQLGITDLSLYFSSAGKGLKIPFKKIVTFQHYEDGIGIQRDSQTALPQIFVTGDGWFICNIVTKLAAI